VLNHNTVHFLQKNLHREGKTGPKKLERCDFSLLCGL